MEMASSWRLRKCESPRAPPNSKIIGLLARLSLVFATRVRYKPVNRRVVASSRYWSRQIPNAHDYPGSLSRIPKEPLIVGNEPRLPLTDPARRRPGQQRRRRRAVLRPPSAIRDHAGGGAGAAPLASSGHYEFLPGIGSRSTQGFLSSVLENQCNRLTKVRQTFLARPALPIGARQFSFVLPPADPSKPFSVTTDCLSRINHLRIRPRRGIVHWGQGGNQLWSLSEIASSWGSLIGPFPVPGPRPLAPGPRPPAPGL